MDLNRFQADEDLEGMKLVAVIRTVLDELEFRDHTDESIKEFIDFNVKYDRGQIVEFVFQVILNNEEVQIEQE
jgi:hypothetical protein